MSYELDASSPRIKQQNGLKNGIKFKPHQLSSIKAMHNLENESCIKIVNPDDNTPLYRIIRSYVNYDKFVKSTFEIETTNGILADAVGSGKTLMIIGLILYSKKTIEHN